jgi:hypothetical protein
MVYNDRFLPLAKTDILEIRNWILEIVVCGYLILYHFFNLWYNNKRKIFIFFARVAEFFRERTRYPPSGGSLKQIFAQKFGKPSLILKYVS